MVMQLVVLTFDFRVHLTIIYWFIDTSSHNMPRTRKHLLKLLGLLRFISKLLESYYVYESNVFV